MVAPAILALGIASGRAADSSGSGAVIGARGEVLTNAHVVKNCTQITVRSSSGDSAPGVLIALDEQNDLAVVRSQTPLSPVSVLRDEPIRAGDSVVALGYPLSGLLATTANLTVGNVSALAGLGDDSRYLQISAPVQPGNSGGPLLDASGHLVGIVTGKLDAALVAQFTGDIPQNVNFAIKVQVVRTFLDSKGITYQTARSDQQLSPADVGDIARPFTVQIGCKESEQSVAAISPPPTTTTPPTTATVRALLYEETPSNQWGNQYVGSATWRTETASPPGQPSQLVIRADIKIPQRHMSVVWELSRGNIDPTVPASHTILVTFISSAAEIGNVPGILLKDAEEARGSPLAGVAVKVLPNFFLIGLSQSPQDIPVNIELLKDRTWFDIPIVYNNGTRAILALQKGKIGNRIFADAFAAWGQ